MLPTFLLDFAQFCRNSPNFAGIQNPAASGRIRDASGIGTSSAGFRIWPIDPLLASSSAQPAAALRDFRMGKSGVPLRTQRSSGSARW